MRSQLPHLVKLLDDEEPAVQAKLEELFSECSGDLSKELRDQGLQLTPAQQAHLSLLLGPGRRRTLRSEWFVPNGGLQDSDSGWATFEMLLRLLSDLLHDGVTIRPNLVEALDELADEVSLCGADSDEEALCEYLFGSGRFRPNSQGYYDPENYRRGALNLMAYYKISDDSGLTIHLAPGLQRDETMAGWEFLPDERMGYQSRHQPPYPQHRNLVR